MTDYEKLAEEWLSEMSVAERDRGTTVNFARWLASRSVRQEGAAPTGQLEALREECAKVVERYVEEARWRLARPGQHSADGWTWRGMANEGGRIAEAIRSIPLDVYAAVR